MKLTGFKDYQDERYDKALSSRNVRARLEGYKVLGKAEDGFMVRVGDCESYGCWVDDGEMPESETLFSKGMDDQGGSQMHIYIEDGEVRVY